MQKQGNLHEAMFRLGRLNITAVVPELCQAEVIVMKAIADCVEQSGCIEQGVNVSSVVNRLCIAPPAVSRTLNSLEEKNLIVRSVNKSDRRNTLVTLTDLGWEKNRDSGERISGFMRKIFSRVGEDKVAQTIAYINEIYEVAREELDLVKKNGE